MEPSINTIANFGNKFFGLSKGKFDSDLPKKNSKDSIKAREAGNKLYSSRNHDRKIHSEILSLYTKSIAFAEENSNELALGYGNRSALLFHLQKYKECLIDIERACKITKSDELKKKLAARKQDCFKQLVRVLRKDKPEIPTLNFKPSKDIPCASEFIKLEYNKKYGRHVVAAQDIQPGTVIVVEKNFVSFPHMKNIYLNCSHCLTVAWTGIPCQGCTVAIYCSEKCKEDAWQEYHDIECQILPYFSFLTEDFECSFQAISSLSLTTRLFIKFVKTEGLLDIIKKAKVIDQYKDNKLHGFQCNSFRFIYNLSDKECLLEDHNFCKNVIEILLKKSKIFNDNTNCETVDESTVSCVVEIFKKLRSITGKNRYKCEAYGKGVKDLDEINFGSMINPFSSLFNHSCVCNVEKIITNNQEILLFTTTFIPKGQQLFVNYGTTESMSKKERHGFLGHHSFVCDCQACKEDWPCLIAVEQDLDPKDVLNIYLKISTEFEEDHVFETFTNIMDSSDKWLFTKYSLEDAAKVMNVICNKYSGRKVYGLSYGAVKYLIHYYNHFYSIKYDIPNDC